MAPIAEPGRYYADLATIVLRTGLLLVHRIRDREIGAAATRE